MVTTDKAQKLDTTLADQINAATQAKVARERRSWSVALDGGKDERLTVALEKRRDGAWRTYARVTTGTGKARRHVRGATGTHADEKQARAAQEALVARAIKDGWRRRESRGGGFAARPDAFTLATMPKPTATKK